MSLDEKTTLKLNTMFNLGTKAFNIAEEIVRKKGLLSPDDKKILAKKYNTKKNYIYKIIMKLRKEGLINGEPDDEPEDEEEEQGTREDMTQQRRNQRTGKGSRKPSPLTDEQIKRMDEAGKKSMGDNYMSMERLEALKKRLEAMGIPREAIKKQLPQRGERRTQTPHPSQPSMGDERPRQVDIYDQGYDEPEYDEVYETDSPDMVTLEEASLKTMPAKVQAKHLVIYDMARAGAFTGALRDFNGNWSDFINTCLDDYFSKVHNVGVGLLARRFA